jgi:L-alanine-DL-glutamate epimerase-like enolase superfamily enzyme
MVRVTSCRVLEVDLPFRRPFEHAAARRDVSESVFFRCTTDRGTVGFGESLPRSYVTGESRNDVYRLLRDNIAPRLLGRCFDSFEAVTDFLDACDGKAPAEWVDPGIPQCAAWCAVDLAFLDTFGREFGRAVLPADSAATLAPIRYSGALSASSRRSLIKTCLLQRAFGLRQIKMKVGYDGDVAALKTARKLLGPKAQIRVDANMAWTLEQAQAAMGRMADLGVRSFEQPLAAGAIEEMATLVGTTGLTVVADESFNDRASLQRLIADRACTAVNVRISKCGGLRASLRRCREAAEAGLLVQVGCQVGESSLLSAAQQALLAQGPQVICVEGAFGRHLLRDDVARPILQFGYGGRSPKPVSGLGLGVTVDETRLRRVTVRSDDVSD